MSGEPLLSALLLGDSALPIGRFAHSHGLEGFLAAERELPEESLLELVETAVLESAGPLDGAACALAHRAGTQLDVRALVELDRRVTARKLCPASRKASTSCGRRLAALAPLLVHGAAVEAFAAKVAASEAEGNLAVVEGVVGCALGLSGRQAVLLSLRGFAASLLSSAVRLGRLPALRSPVLLRRAEPALLEATTEAIAAADLRSTLPELEIFALAHRRADARLFAT
jgi:urease accessory protein